MPWKLAEKALFPKFSRGSEDGILANDHIAFLGDGVSDCYGEMIGNLTPGQFAIKAGIDALIDFLGRPEELVPFLTSSLGCAIASAHRPNPCGRPSFVFVAFFQSYDMIVRVGDCQYLTDGAGYNPGLMVDRVKVELRAGLIGEMLSPVSDRNARSKLRARILEHDPTADIMLEMTRLWQPRYANDPDPVFGYGVINGSTVPNSKIEYIRVPRDAREIILTSDGYCMQVVRGTLAATEREMHALLERDPLCIREWPSVRGLLPGCDRIDDCTYVRLVRE
jgi:hypothetical protein